MYLTNYVFGEVKIDCRNEVSKNVRVLGTNISVASILFFSYIC